MSLVSKLGLKCKVLFVLFLSFCDKHNCGINTLMNVVYILKEENIFDDLSEIVEDIQKQ